MAAADSRVRLDLNSPEFQEVFFRLEPAELKQVVAFREGEFLRLISLHPA